MTSPGADLPGWFPFRPAVVKEARRAKQRLDRIQEN